MAFEFCLKGLLTMFEVLIFSMSYGIWLITGSMYSCSASLNAELLLDVIINDIVFITAFIQYQYIVG